MTAPFDLIFGLSAIAFNLLIAGVFIASRHAKMRLVHQIGIALLALAIPFALVLYHALTAVNDPYVSIALGFVLLYLLAELLLDFILKIDFRSRFITHFPYILLEYSAFAGLLYTAFSISRPWGWAVSITFWVAMLALIYYFTGLARKKTP